MPIIVESNPSNAELFTSVTGPSSHVVESLDELKRSLPPGYRIEAGGAFEENVKAQSSIAAGMPMMFAVVLGMLHSSALPAPLTASNDNHEKGYVSRDGIKMIFNDDEKSYKLETPGGKKITLSDKDGVVLIEDENGNSVKMEASGVTVESASSLTLKAATDIKLEAVNIMLSPSSQFSVSAAGSEIKAGGGSAELKSASVKVEGSGITEIKGGLVKIN